MSHPESTFVPRSTGPHLRAHAAFTLIELLVVIINYHDNRSGPFSNHQLL